MPCRKETPSALRYLARLSLRSMLSFDNLRKSIPSEVLVAEEDKTCSTMSLRRTFRNPFSNFLLLAGLTSIDYHVSAGGPDNRAFRVFVSSASGKNQAGIECSAPACIILKGPSGPSAPEWLSSLIWQEAAAVQHRGTCPCPSRVQDPYPFPCPYRNRGRSS